MELIGRYPFNPARHIPSKEAADLRIGSHTILTAPDIPLKQCRDKPS